MGRLILDPQGRNHDAGVQSKVGQVRKFPISRYFPRRNFHFGTSQTISVVSKCDKEKKKKKERKKEKKKVICSFSHISPSILKFPPPFYNFPSFPLHFPFFLASLLFPPLSPSPFPFSSFPPSFQKFPQTFQGWATRPPSPPLVTPLLTLVKKAMKKYLFF